MHYWMPTEVHKLRDTFLKNGVFFILYPFYIHASIKNTSAFEQIKDSQNKLLFPWALLVETLLLFWGRNWRRHPTNLRLLTIHDFGGVHSIRLSGHWGVCACESATVNSELKQFSASFLNVNLWQILFIIY